MMIGGGVAVTYRPSHENDAADAAGLDGNQESSAPTCGKRASHEK